MNFLEKLERFLKWPSAKAASVVFAVLLLWGNYCWTNDTKTPVAVVNEFPNDAKQAQSTPHSDIAQITPKAKERISSEATAANTERSEQRAQLETEESQKVSGETASNNTVGQKNADTVFLDAKIEKGVPSQRNYQRQ